MNPIACRAMTAEYVKIAEELAAETRQKLEAKKPEDDVLKQVTAKYPHLAPKPLEPKTKQASVSGGLGRRIGGRIGQHLANHNHAYDLAGLGVLAAPSAVGVGHAIQAKRKGEPVDKSGLWHHGAELAGLGLIAAPVAAEAMGFIGKHAGTPITDDEARRSLDRLDTLEHSKPTVGQVGRYAALGAAAPVALKLVSNTINGKPLKDFGQAQGKSLLRGVAATSLGGATMSGALPLARNAMDRHVETSTLKQYLKERQSPGDQS